MCYWKRDENVGVTLLTARDYFAASRFHARPFLHYIRSAIKGNANSLTYTFFATLAERIRIHCSTAELYILEAPG
jgi:hypothetical protein